ncbi:CRP-like cAMP-binding protein [Pedobacter sp. AK017]|uniref:Crp/Fnr family transcriptional regulator n=1 Tax=Pedobacter sp. AK017 TaxID=2723073 RepID=UPI00161E0CAA|nr:Crp/Fnr family transcriptional regulator [Pedobacter sp. AK017]MBB5440623.1 CRP-like cAMP-binding protein [Pedobacter sp. AK017]
MNLNYSLSPDEVIKILTFITPLSDRFQQYIIKRLKTKKFAKNEFVLEEGQVCQNVYFVYQGLLRSLFYNEKGHECTGWFVQKGDLMISVYSYFNQVPAAESIQALEPSILQYLSWQEMQTAYNDFVEADKLGRLIVEKYYTLSEGRSILLRNPDPTFRYKLMLETYKDIMLRASKTQVASYLGISRETLSRLLSAEMLRS